MKIRYHIILLAAAALCGVSCKGFLTEHTQNQSYITDAADLDELMMGEGYVGKPAYFTSTFYDSRNVFSTNGLGFLFVIDDDSHESPRLSGDFGTTSEVPWESLAGQYKWSVDPHTTINGTSYADEDFAAFYRRIAVCNTVLASYPELLEEKPHQSADLYRVAAEAHFLRAWNYFMLVNIYGSPYSADNADDPHGVPLKLDDKVTEYRYPRETTGRIYRQIEDDLTAAVACFEREGVKASASKQRVSPNACHLLLSRVCLYMERYGEAIEWADRIAGPVLTNLHGFAPSESFAALESAETIFSQGHYNMHHIHGEDKAMEYSSKPVFNYETREYDLVETVTEHNFAWSYSLSEDLDRLFDKENDLRYRAFFKKSAYREERVCRKFRGIETTLDECDPVDGSVIAAFKKANPASSYCWLRYAEALLNKAEAQACIGDPQAAATLARLLETRYEVMPAIPAAGNELIEMIRNERRRELCYEGHRWFDLRRYAVNAKLPQTKSITHRFHRIEGAGATRKAVPAGTSTLAPYGETSKGSWVMPLPSGIIEYGNGNITNQLRAGVTEQLSATE